MPLLLPSGALRKREGAAPPLRLPSGATRHTLRATYSQGDQAISPPASDDEELCPAQSRRGSVQRSRFFLKHASSAEFQEAYDVEKRAVGEGGFGTVHRARLRGVDGVLRAVKFINKRNVRSERSILNEASILRRLDHPHICRLIETFEGSKFVYLVMEYVDGQELFDYIQQACRVSNFLDEQMSSTIMRQVFGALQYCHAGKIIHMDLKPENIMVQRQPKASRQDVQIKLIDFGLSMLCRPGHLICKAITGTDEYLAPEVRETGSASSAADLWSVGVVLHALLTGVLPPESVRLGFQALPIHTATYETISHAAKELLCDLLQADPQLRITAARAVTYAWTQGEVEADEDASPRQGSRQLHQTMIAFLSFHRSNLLRRAVLTAVAMQIGSQQISHLREQFLRVDTDGNGKISREELVESIKVGSPELSSDQWAWINTIFDSVDTDGSQELEFTEWVAAALQLGNIQADEAMRAAFRSFDVDGNGKISLAEINRVVHESAEDIAHFLPMFDSDGDGELDFEEFRSVVNGFAERNRSRHVTRTSTSVTKMSTNRSRVSSSMNTFWNRAKAFFHGTE